MRWIFSFQNGTTPAIPSATDRISFFLFSGVLCLEVCCLKPTSLHTPIQKCAGSITGNPASAASASAMRQLRAVPQLSGTRTLVRSLHRSWDSGLKSNAVKDSEMFVFVQIALDRPDLRPMLAECPLRPSYSVISPPPSAVSSAPIPANVSLPSTGRAGAENPSFPRGNGSWPGSIMSSQG